MFGTIKRILIGDTNSVYVKKNDLTKLTKKAQMANDMIMRLKRSGWPHEYTRSSLHKEDCRICAWLSKLEAEAKDYE